MILPSTIQNRGDFHQKMDKGARRKFWKELLRDTKVLFYGRGLIFVSPLRDINSKTTHHLLLYCFGSNFTQKGSAKAPAVGGPRCGPVEVEQFKRHQNHFLTPKRYRPVPCLFISGECSSPPGSRSLSGSHACDYWIYMFLQFGNFCLQSPNYQFKILFILSLPRLEGYNLSSWARKIDISLAPDLSGDGGEPPSYLRALLRALFFYLFYWG